MNKRTIRLTALNYNVMNEKLIEVYANYTLMLRTARKVGDTEVVNNYVLGKLEKAKAQGLIDFEVLTD